MSVSVEVDDEVFAELQTRAVPLVDTPNSVLRRILGLDASGAAPVPDSGSRKVQRARVGELLSEKEYELPILRYLLAHGGEAPTADVIDAVGQEVADRLTETDKTYNNSGLIRWQNRVQFARLTLVKSGDMDGASPRGTWRITEQGRRRAQAA